jgi:hypothetical protein
MSFEIENDKELMRKLDGLEKKIANKIAKKAVLTGVKMIAKAIKREIPSTQKSARKAIGYRAIRATKGKGKGFLYAKAGGAVGFTKSKMAKQGQKTRKSGRKGVGISASNIHWILNGTKDRWTGTKRIRRKGKEVGRVDTGGKKKFTGRMKKSGIVKRAWSNVQGAVKAVIAGQIAIGIRDSAR